MIRLLALWLALTLLTGCVGPQVRPDAMVLASRQHIHFVPMEMPPLMIDASYAATGTASIVHYLPRYTIGMARTVGVLSGIALLVEWPEISRRRIEFAPDVQQRLKSADEWLLTVELAKAAGSWLAAHGRMTSQSRDIHAIPGIEERNRTVFMENWMAPIRAWYNNETPTPGTTVLNQLDASLIVDVGVSNYEIHAGKLLLQVHVRLIDPATGRLLGRARDSSFTEQPPMDTMFADDARAFKAASLTAGSRLLASCLQELGLLTRPPPSL
jgi:hypothetical protein